MTSSFRTTRRAFTLIEILVSILIIIVLMGLLIVAVRHAIGFTKGTRDRAQVTALKNGVTHFNNEFKFNPLLVKDFDPLGPVKTVGGRNVPNVYSGSNPTDALRLRNQDPATPASPDIRFSVYSLPYYLVGALDMSIDPGNPSGASLDGVAGLGFLTPKRDGTFEKAGRKFDPFFDVGKNSKVLYAADTATGRVTLRDANEVPIRYYHWLQGDAANGNRVAKPDDANVPEILYRLPGETTPAGPDLLSADWAIVAAGPNGVFGDEADLFNSGNAELAKLGMSWEALATKVGVSGNPASDPTLQPKVRAAAMKDNIVEVGK